MKLKKPKFWDYKKPNIISFLLFPLTILIRINNFLNHYKKNINNKFQNYKIKTICIGNIYLGGTGKTPIAIKINEILKILKYKTVFIKKYYSESLDEYRLLKKYGSVISDNKRIESLNKANKDNEIAIFDDGLQDSSINYDLKLVCFNTSNFIGNGMLLPAGPLREKISSLKKYDAVFLNGNDERIDEITSVIKRYNNSIKIFNSTYVLIDLDILDKKNKYVAFAGIGNPKNFYSTLSNAGINVVKFLEYPDHYVYDESDIKKIKDMAINFGAKIITTEKDYSRLEISNNPLLKENIQFLKMELKIKNENDLINFIKMKI
jgi:tetraacyldisaccharide 4'-kinase